MAAKTADRNSSVNGIGERLREIRRGRALTQAELAERASIGADVVSQLENDHRAPRTKTIRNLAEALGVRVESLTGAPEPLDVQTNGVAQMNGKKD